MIAAPPLRHALGAASVGVALGLLAVHALGSDRSATVGAPAKLSLAGTAYRRLDGSRATFQRTRGAVRVVNFWATSCPPCVRELPTLAALDDRFGPSVEFIGISSDDPRVAAMAADAGVTYALGNDPDGELMGSLGLSLIPSTVVLAPDASVVDVISGPVDEVDLTNRIELALKETRSTRGS